jgi:hypothetical protein
MLGLMETKGSPPFGAKFHPTLRRSPNGPNGPTVSEYSCLIFHTFEQKTINGSLQGATSDWGNCAVVARALAQCRPAIPRSEQQKGDRMHSQLLAKTASMAVMKALQIWRSGFQRQ